MLRGLVVVLSLLATSACAGTTARDTVTGNVVAPSSVSTPQQVRWVSGQLMNEPAPDGSACLLLVTSKDKYVLRSVNPSLVPVVWHQDGSFDATRSGILRGDRMAVPYSDERTSVRGGVVAKSDSSCGDHPTLAFTRVRRVGGAAPPVDRPTDADTLEGIPDGAETWTSGRLEVVPARGDAHCLLFVTSSGRYVLGTGTPEYDLTLSTVEGGGIIRRQTGIHVAGRGALDMARVVGQRVELLGTALSGTDYPDCSRYQTFSMTDLR